LTVNWGDGEVRNLGPINGTSVQSHVFNDPGTYLVTGTLLDTAGNSQSVSTTVTVIPAPQPTIIITPSPVPGHVGAQTTISVQITLPSGLAVTNLKIDFGDGTSSTLGGATSAAVPHVYTAVGTYTVTVTVTDTSGHSTIGTAVVSIAI
jgi:PKD repeat protein